MKALAVIDKNLAIGNKGNLLFHLPTDLAHFKRHTIGRTVVMGQKTLESMPKGRPLPGRNTLVLNIDAPTGLIEELAGGFVCYSFQSLDDYHAYLDEHPENEVIVSGGATIYRLLLDDCDELVLTEVDAEAPEADAYFPEFRDAFELAGEEGPFFDGELRYWIRDYRRKK